MGLQSLREKLLQAGLVNEDQAKKAEADVAAQKRAARSKQRGQQGRGRGGGQGGQGRQGRRQGQQERQQRPLTPEEIQAREEEEAFRQRERELNREREENRKRAAADRKRQEELRSLAETSGIEERGDHPFHFVSRKRKLMRIYLTEEQIASLEAGALAIIDKPLPAELSQALVPREAAEKALALDPKAIRFYNRGEGEAYGFQQEDAAPATPEETASQVADAPAAPEGSTGS